MDVVGTGSDALRKIYRRWHWPAGWWRLRGFATLDLAGVPIRFAGVAGSDHEWWAKQSRKHAWEAPVVESFVRAVPRGAVVFDVGAWIGPYTLLAAKLAGPEGRVFAFEPDPMARKQLERNVALNEAANVEIVPLALGSSSGTAWLSGGLSEATVGRTGDVAVETVSLTEFIANAGAEPDVMKIDIEGGELDLETQALRRVPEIFLEIHASAFRDRQVDPDDFLREVAGDRRIVRLEGDAENYNVRIAS
jgi:FkbM family methyltransferase